MIRSSSTLASRTLRHGRALRLLKRRRPTASVIATSVSANTSLNNLIIRRFSASEKPKVPPPTTTATEATASELLAPIGDSDHLPAKLIDFQVASKIEGEESMIATVQLKPGETLRAEAGNMLFMTEGIIMDTSLSGASSAFSRLMTGQNMFLTDFKYEGAKGTQGTVSLGTEFPSKIMRFSLEDFDNNSLICQRGAYLASNATVNIEMEFTKTLTAGFFGGQGFILQRLSGQGDVLVKGGGTIVCKVLDTGESLRVTSGSIVAFEPTVSYDVQMMQGVKNTMFGGEGLFIAKLEGPGRVWLQGMPADRMIAEIARRVPAGGPGLGVPIGMGMGGGGGGDAVGAGEAGTVGEEAGAGVAGGEDMVAASDAAIEGERQATVATSGAMASGGDVDVDSQSALFGDALPDDANNDFGNSIDDDTTTTDSFGDDDSWANSSSEEMTFMDNNEDSFTTEEPAFKDESFFDESSTTTEGLDGGEIASDEGGGFLSTVWDFFTSDD